MSRSKFKKGDRVKEKAKCMGVVPYGTEGTVDVATVRGRICLL